MNRTVKYALSAALAAVFVVPAFAQSDTPFPDTKENHWAYEAVTRLKAEGILVGYPNGNFIGGRLATRYE
ncbi:S-layer homology domain-containing protein, partial [Staphylococcus aureus]|uniref:S-layer homology domain-containing protein n=1 Tax=Staphylococcus aureus TaxID=1280 RepID=UPI001916C60C